MSIKQIVLAALLIFATMVFFAVKANAGPVEDRARLGQLLGNLSVSYDLGHKATSKYLLKEIGKITTK